jgi:adenylate cyclase
VRTYQVTDDVSPFGFGKTMPEPPRNASDHLSMVTDELWEQAAVSDAGIRIGVVFANLVGVAVVTLEVAVIGVPGTRPGERFHGAFMATEAALLVYVALATIVELRVSRVRQIRTFGWVAERRQPTPEETAAVVRFPSVEARQLFGWWAGGALLVTAINLGFSNDAGYCFRAGLNTVLGGLTAASLSFLLLERFNRPVFALALAGDPDDTVTRLGLERRLLLTWALGAAVPVAVITTAPLGVSAARRAALGGPLLVVGTLALAAGLVLTILAARSITEPIDTLRRAHRRVESGDLDTEVTVDDAGEIGLLQAGFNRMTAGLRERQRIDDLFGRHVGVEVARQALSQNPRLGGELRDASVLFIDLVGSTSLAERLSPDQIVTILNDFFSAVVHCTDEGGGWVNKFEGDAALCVFGPPGDSVDHAACALRAARRLQVTFAELATKHSDFDAGVGVSSGTVVAGNIGAENRYEYTVIGAPVNEAARLTEEAKSHPGRVLATGAAVEAAAGEGAHWHACAPKLLRGKSSATQIYAPISPPQQRAG